MNRPLNDRVEQVKVRMDARTIPFRPKPLIIMTKRCGPSGLFSPGEPNAPGYSAALIFGLLLPRRDHYVVSRQK